MERVSEWRATCMMPFRFIALARMTSIYAACHRCRLLWINSPMFTRSLVQCSAEYDAAQTQPSVLIYIRRHTAESERYPFVLAVCVDEQSFTRLCTSLIRVASNRPLLCVCVFLIQCVHIAYGWYHRVPYGLFTESRMAIETAECSLHWRSRYHM